MDRYDELKSLLTLALTKIKALEGRIEDLEEESFLDIYETCMVESIEWKFGSEPKHEGRFLVSLDGGFVGEADYEDGVWVRYHNSIAEPIEDYLGEVVAYADMPSGVESEDEEC